MPNGWNLDGCRFKEVGCSRVQEVRCLGVEMEGFQGYKGVGCLRVEMEGFQSYEGVACLGVEMKRVPELQGNCKELPGIAGKIAESFRKAGCHIRGVGVRKMDYCESYSREWMHGKRLFC